MAALLSTPINLGILVDQGKEIPKLLREAKKRPVAEDADIQGKVKNIVTSVLHYITNSPEDAFLPKESIEKLVKKLEGTLDEFIKHDPEYKSGYEDLIKEVGNFQYRKQVSFVASDLSDANSFPDINRSNEPDIDYSEIIKLLDDDEYRCLYCFLLFPAEAEIKKREIIHCWIAMDKVDLLDNETLLAKFVEMGLIKRSILNKKLLNIYKMPGSVHTRLSDQQTNQSPPTGNSGSWSILNKPPPQNGNEPNNKAKKKPILKRIVTMKPSSKKKHKPNISQVSRNFNFKSTGSYHHETTDPDPIALLNINQTTLNVERFKTMSRMSDLKIVHLGSWQQDSKKYIVVEDVKAFKHLKKLSKVKFLSLEGVSGMIKLPKYVYKLRSLKVLDLRGCNNLELFAYKIKRLTNLTHLDLSGCYLLDHIPFGITYLTNLSVLKGFVINNNNQPQPQPQPQKKSKKEKNMEKRNQCPFNELSKLTKLSKLTIINRSDSFPTQDDFVTFSEMEHLRCLRITWVGDSTKKVPIEGDVPVTSPPVGARKLELSSRVLRLFKGRLSCLGIMSVGDSTMELPAEIDVPGISFPPSLRKLELQAAPDQTALRVLRAASDETGHCGLQKLYLRGGGLRHLKHFFPEPTVVRLRYLPELQIEWDDFKKLFPNLDRLEVQGCPNLELFPCNENGVWENTHRLSNN